MMRSIGLALLAGALLAAGCHRRPAAPLKVMPANDTERTLYALGDSLGFSVSGFYPTPREAEVIAQGLIDHLTRARTQVDLGPTLPQVDKLVEARRAAKQKQIETMSRAFLDGEAQKPGAVKLPSGLVFRALRPGTGAAPDPSGHVRVHYVASFPEGTVFDSTVQRGRPTDLDLGKQLPCVQEGIGRMHAGERATFACPPELAYQDAGMAPNVPPRATVVYDVELLEVLQ